MRRIIRHGKRLGIGIIGGVVVLAGVIMIPYPGPGWLVVFAGLAILATEFERAERILAIGRKYYDAWALWLARQTWWIRGLTLLFTALVVVTTVWLVNGFGIINGLLRLDQLWLESPFVK